jgi:hypothetical protein
MIKISPCEPLSKVSNEWILNACRQVLSFTPAVPRVVLNPNPALVEFKQWKIVSGCIGFAVLALGIWSCMWAMIAYRVVASMKLWLVSGGVVFPVLGCIGYFFFQKLKGFSTSARAFLTFLIPFAIGLVLLGRFGSAVFNGYFDTSVVQQFDQPVIDKYITQHKSSRYYHIVVSAWNAQSVGWNFEVSDSIYDRTQIGKTRCRILTKSGCFGYEWVVSEQIVL